jgi:putative NADPH-quinone reductase
MALAQHRSDLWISALRVFILYANPLASSFGAALHKQCVAILRSRGHEFDDCDLYVERFYPVLSEQERKQYHDTRLNRRASSANADRLLAAEALILIYPVWNEGFPAILKGFLDRVFIPGVSFTIGPNGAPIPNLQNLRRVGALHLWRQLHDEFFARGPSQTCGETLGTFHARPRRPLRLPRPLPFGSFQSQSASQTPDKGKANV